MRIVIMGCGRVGAALASDFSREGHDVTILDTDPQAFRFLPDDFVGQKVVGNGIDLDALRRIHLDRADAFVSATRGDNRNVMAAQIAKHIFGVKVVASRVFDPLREEMYRNMGLRTINPTRVQTNRLRKVVEAATDDEANDLVMQFMQQDGFYACTSSSSAAARSGSTWRKSWRSRTTRCSSSSRTRKRRARSRTSWATS